MDPMDILRNGGGLQFDDLPDDPSPSNTLTVHNILASASLCGGERLDLDKCCQVLGNSFYNPAEFPALRIDVRGRSRAVYTISLFESGRIQSAGGCRPVEAKKAMMKIGRRLNQKFNCGVILHNFEIQNILAVFDACCPVNLGHFSATFTGSVDYEPDRFPAARVRIPIPSKKGINTTMPEDKSDSAEHRASMKLRKLMMGDSVAEADLAQPMMSGGVGSYVISANSKRVASSRQKDEKAVKEEVVTANVFSTGKITFTGSKSIASLNFALEKLKPAIGLHGNGMPFTSPMGEIPRQMPYYPPTGYYTPNQYIPQQMNPSPFPGSLDARTQQLAMELQQLHPLPQQYLSQYERLQSPVVSHYQSLAPLGIPRM